ncbi:MAG: gamma-glutamyl-gamma-aminobutyrate hydrolase family protein [Actinobacteria bacterium]|nr:gamma-glutamyl-gamma-aminobutyrate hydrolase family protein [Actinomycetota bacterium]
MDTTKVPTHMSRNGHIAITSLKRNGRMRPPTDYVLALQSAGGYPRVFSTHNPASEVPIPAGMDLTAGLDPDDLSPLDGAIGLLLPGGGDIDPAMYGREPHPQTHGVNRRRDRFEMNLLRAALERDLPVLAVCRGMQMLNVVLGGTLDQHLADDAGLLDHYRDRPRAEHAHSVDVKPESLMASIFETNGMPVNSHHHQGLDVVSPQLRHVAWAEDGVLEGVEAREHSWVVGVQWHPEVMAPVEARQLKIFEHLVEAARAYAGRALAQAASA